MADTTEIQQLTELILGDASSPRTTKQLRVTRFYESFRMVLEKKGEPDPIAERIGHVQRPRPLDELAAIHAEIVVEKVEQGILSDEEFNQLVTDLKNQPN